MWICALVTSKLPSQHREFIEKSPPGQYLSQLCYKHVLCPCWGAQWFPGGSEQASACCFLLLCQVFTVLLISTAASREWGLCLCFCCIPAAGKLCCLYTEVFTTMTVRNKEFNAGWYFHSVTERMCKSKSSSAQFGLFRNYLKHC